MVAMSPLMLPPWLVSVGFESSEVEVDEGAADDDHSLSLCEELGEGEAECPSLDEEEDGDDHSSEDDEAEGLLPLSLEVVVVAEPDQSTSLSHPDEDEEPPEDDEPLPDDDLPSSSSSSSSLGLVQFCPQSAVGEGWAEVVVRGRHLPARFAFLRRTLRRVEPP